MKSYEEFVLLRMLKVEEDRSTVKQAEESRKLQV